MSADTMLDVLFWVGIAFGLVTGLRRESPKQPGIYWALAVPILFVWWWLWISWGSSTGHWDIARIPIAVSVASFVGALLTTIARETK